MHICFHSKAPESRGRVQEPRRSLSDLNSPSTTFSFYHAHSLPVSPKRVPVETTKPDSSGKSTTLFDAVISRSADVKLSPSMYTKHRLTPTTLSSPDLTPSEDESVLTGGTNLTINVNQTKKISAVLDRADAAHTSSLIPLKFDVSDPKSSPSAITPSNKPTASQFNTCYITSEMDSTAFTHPSFPPCSRSAYSSPTKSKKSNTESTAAPEKTSRLKPGDVLIQEFKVIFTKRLPQCSVFLCISYKTKKCAHSKLIMTLQISQNYYDCLKIQTLSLGTT